MTDLPIIIAYQGPSQHDWEVRLGTQKPPKGYSPAYIFRHLEEPEKVSPEVSPLPFWVRSQATTRLAARVPLEQRPLVEPLSWSPAQLLSYGLQAVPEAVTLRDVKALDESQFLRLLVDLSRLGPSSHTAETKLTLLTGAALEEVSSFLEVICALRGWDVEGFDLALRLLGFSARGVSVEVLEECLVDPLPFFLEVAENPEAPGKLALQVEPFNALLLVTAAPVVDTRPLDELFRGEASHRELFFGILAAYQDGVSPFDLRVVQLMQRLSPVYRVLMHLKAVLAAAGISVEFQHWAYKVLLNSKKVMYV